MCGTWNTNMEEIDWDCVELDELTLEQLEAKEGELFEELEEHLSENTMEKIRLLNSIARELEIRG